MTYQATLEYLYAQLPMFQRQGAPAFKKDLTNTIALLEFLGHPERQFRAIHVGGTNGKGSISNLLAATFQAAGYRTGLYTSPHYLDFRERIRIDGAYIPEHRVVDFVAQVRPVIERIQPSFFELTVAMAFWQFAAEKVDMAIVEVGLGGRLDSTNVLHPDLSLISNISFDHQQFLGDTLPLIAAEKAGIIKPQTPVIIGQRQSEVAAVFLETAQERGAPLHFGDALYQAERIRETLATTFYRIHREGKLAYEALEVGLHGPYQAFNVQTALAAVDVWQRTTGNSLPPEALLEGFRDLRRLTGFLGRWQVLREHPLVLVDSAHNEAGLRYAMQGLQAQSYQRLHFILGVVQDKELSDILPLLPTSATYYFAKAAIPRGLDASVLQVAASKYGLQGKVYTSVVDAYQKALQQADPADLIFVGGSIFTVAEVLGVAL